MHVGGKNKSEQVEMTIYQQKEFFRTIDMEEHDRTVAKRLLDEINNRLGFLDNVGLSYLTLNRLSNTLSGGESQRINLSTSLGSSLVGSLYILEEPSIGLHSRATARPIKVLRQSQPLGSTVCLVDPREEIIRHADTVTDTSPVAARVGVTTV